MGGVLHGTFWNFLVKLPYGEYVYFLAERMAPSKEAAERLITEWHNSHSTYGVWEGTIVYVGKSHVDGFTPDFYDEEMELFRLGSTE